MSKNIAVFGLGSMGQGVATSILRSDHQVWGFDVSDEAVQRFINAGGQAAPLKSIGHELDIAVVVVLNAEQTESVVDDLLAVLEVGAVIISCATVPPQFARELSVRCQDKGVLYLDAPISGGSIKAAEGALTVMAAGSDTVFESAKPALDAMAERVFCLSQEVGAGSAMKAVNQLLAGVHIATMAEAMTFGMTQGMQPAQMLEVISECAGSSWMFENRGPHIVEGDYSPHSAVNIWLKDLGIVLDIAQSAGFDAPVTKQALNQFTEASNQGYGLEDDAAVAKVYAAQANLSLPGAG